MHTAYVFIVPSEVDESCGIRVGLNAGSNLSNHDVYSYQDQAPLSRRYCRAHVPLAEKCTARSFVELAILVQIG